MSLCLLFIVLFAIVFAYCICVAVLLSIFDKLWHYHSLKPWKNNNAKCSLKFMNMLYTVEPFYNRHLGTRYFWPLFAVSEVKNNYIVDTSWDQKFCTNYEGFYCFLNLEGLERFHYRDDYNGLTSDHFTQCPTTYTLSF